jgi:hypothetical protein
MRTTLTLDPDVAQRLKSRMAEQKATLKQVVNEALRRGLAAEQPRPGEPFRVLPHSFGLRPGIDVRRLNQLVDELEVRSFVAKASRRAR